MKRFIILSALLCFLVMPIVVYAHGANIDYTSKASYELIAKYDSGEPMANAQITVYSPEDPATPWAKGTADDNGCFIFTPDMDQKGIWTVQARSAGHGANINIEIGGEAAATGKTGYTLLQKLIMTASVIWGLIGTALYFTRRNTNACS